MSSARAAELGLTPRARFHTFAVTGSDPLLMLTGVVPATRMVLDRAGLSIGDIARSEVNEAFASVPLLWLQDSAPIRRTQPSRRRHRPRARSGSSGTRLLATLVNSLEPGGGRYGLLTMCEGGGMANATIIERLG